LFAFALLSIMVNIATIKTFVLITFFMIWFFKCYTGQMYVRFEFEKTSDLANLCSKLSTNSMLT